jgi:hypothetical protein
VVDILSFGDSWCELEEMSIDRLTMMDSGCTRVGRPSYYIYKGLVGGIRMIELWPVPDALYSLRYTGLLRSALTSAGQLIPDIGQVLLMYAAELACPIVANKLAAEKDYQGAQYWTSQATVWGNQYREQLRDFERKDRHRFGKNTYSEVGYSGRDSWSWPSRV